MQTINVSRHPRAEVGASGVLLDCWAMLLDCWAVLLDCWAVLLVDRRAISLVRRATRLAGRPLTPLKRLGAGRGP